MLFRQAILDDAPVLAVLVGLAAILWSVSACTSDQPVAAGRNDAIPIHYEPHRLSAGEQEIERVGRLLYRGGLLLSAADPRFGGWSGLIVSADGRRLLAQSDQAHWLRADILYDVQGNLAGLGSVELADMRDRDGKRMSKSRGDAEGLTALSSAGPDGPVLVSFEQKARVWRYALERSLEGWPEPVAMPRGIAVGDDNSGLEGLTLLDGSRLFAAIESPKGSSPDLPAWLVCYPRPDSCSGSGALQIAYHPPYHISDTALGPDGRHLYILERRFLGLLGGLRIALREVDIATVKRGARLEGREIAEFDARESMDNMEGLALRRGADGKTYVYMISDDNYDRLLQRTLLLMFELTPPRGDLQ